MAANYRWQFFSFPSSENLRRYIVISHIKMASTSQQSENVSYIRRIFDNDNHENEESDPFDSDSDESWHPSSNSSSSDDTLVSINAFYY